jgi:hypothetical protein
MTNKLKFEIETEAPYTEEEMDALTNSFLDFISDVDLDADVNSVNVSIADVDEIQSNSESTEPTEEQVREAAVGLISNGTLEVSVRIRDLEGTLIHKESLSTDNVEV